MYIGKLVFIFCHVFWFESKNRKKVDIKDSTNTLEIFLSQVVEGKPENGYDLGVTLPQTSRRLFVCLTFQWKGW